MTQQVFTADDLYSFSTSAEGQEAQVKLHHAGVTLALGEHVVIAGREMVLVGWERPLYTDADGVARAELTFAILGFYGGEMSP